MIYVMLEKKVSMITVMLKTRDADCTQPQQTAIYKSNVRFEGETP